MDGDTVKKEITGKGRGKRNTFLYFAAISANLAAFSAGIAFAWSSPAIPKLNGLSDVRNNPLRDNLTAEEESWVASFLPLGAMVGPFGAGFLSDFVGRKIALIISVIPLLLCFITKAYANNVIVFYIARFLGGLGAGSILTVVPMYVGEISEVHNRGRLGCLLAIFVSLGNIFSFSLGPFVDMKLFNICCLIAPLIFLILFTFCIPESPYFLIGKDRQKEARKSLYQFRSKNKDVIEKELLDITKTVKQSQVLQGGLRDIFKCKALLKGLCICLGLVTFQQLTGISVILFYMQSIFESSGSSISSDVSAIIVGITQTIGCTFASTIVEKLGRKFLLLISACGVAVTLAVLGAYFYVKDVGGEVEALFWLPVTSVIVYVALFNIGFAPMPFTILGEMFPPHVKSIASTLTVSTCLFLSFCTTKFFPGLVNVIGNHFSFWIFSVCTFSSAVFIFLFLPETKGKTLQEILNELGNEQD